MHPFRLRRSALAPALLLGAALALSACTAGQDGQGGHSGHGQTSATTSPKQEVGASTENTGNSLLPSPTVQPPPNEDYRLYTVVAATRGGKSVEHTGWDLRLPVEDLATQAVPVGTLTAPGVLGHANFEVTASAPGTFTTRDTGARTLEACTQDCKRREAEAKFAEAALAGTITATASGGDVVLSNGDYTFTMRRG